MGRYVVDGGFRFAMRKRVWALFSSEEVRLIMGGFDSGWSAAGSLLRFISFIFYFYFY